MTLCLVNCNVILGSRTLCLQSLHLPPEGLPQLKVRLKLNFEVCLGLSSRNWDGHELKCWSHAAHPALSDRS